MAGHPPGLLSIHAACQAPPGYELSLSTEVLEQEGWEETRLPSVVPSLCVKHEPVLLQLGVASFLYVLTEEPC